MAGARSGAPCVRIQVLVASVQCRGTRRVEGDEQPLQRGQDMEAWTVPGPGIPEVAFSLLRMEPVAARAPLCRREQLWLQVFPVCWCVRREMEGWPAECHSTQPGWSVSYVQLTRERQWLAAVLPTSGA